SWWRSLRHRVRPMRRVMIEESHARDQSSMRFVMFVMLFCVVLGDVVAKLQPVIAHPDLERLNVAAVGVCDDAQAMRMIHHRARADQLRARGAPTIGADAHGARGL